MIIRKINIACSLLLGDYLKSILFLLILLKKCQEFFYLYTVQGDQLNMAVFLW